ncbi:FAD/NAD(P)-binding domain-containing protein [Aureobasidium pullulans]|uniref:FAD/NAD(P)-binding domain-containing protein n=1 Tax=Aureobasidium pullulans TaxID=5580 RepID=A0A4V4I9Q2_AURPU|nr:FAD/NAD(P)-binding domain-containing protein [Aureobasidium pullulans]
MTTPLKVVVVGGGIAGLTLANALEQASIDYVLLERRQEIAPQVGASIGIMSNGCRIMDQLGCRDALYACVEPIQWIYDRDSAGKLLTKPNGVSQLMQSRSGYGFAFSDRQDILQVLYDNLKDKSKVLVGKKLSLVRQQSNGVTVVCEDGSSYTGDILAGADGVNSKARSEMWRLADEQDPELVKADKNSLECSYQCLYGIASSSAGLTIGDLHVGYNKDCSLMTIVGKDDRTYYFAFEKMDKTYKLPHIPTYTEAEKAEFAERHGNMKATESVQFRDIHKHSVSSTLVGVETASYKIWTWGRIACVGDASHKMTPNAGFGGNAAMESAAALANSIKKLADQIKEGRPTEDQIVACLQGYQENREVRAKAAIDASNLLTRVQALATWGHILFAKYGLTILGDFLENLGSNMAVGATLLDYLPPPEASLKGALPFNPEQGDGHKENFFRRALVALPFLGLFVYAISIANPAIVNTENGGMFDVTRNGTGLPPASIGGQSNRFAMLSNVYIATAENTDLATGFRIATLLAYFGVILAIWSIEAVRRCNALMPVQLPSLFAFLAQSKGVGIVAPLYSFLHWVMTPIDSFKATDMRLTRLNYTRAILPSLLTVYYLPLLQSYFLPDNLESQTWLQIWRYFPIWHSIAQWAISRFWNDTIDEDKICAPKRDVFTIQYTIAVPALLSTVIWLCTVLNTPVSLYHLFIPQHLAQNFTDVQSFSADLVQWDLLLFITSTYLWLFYFAWDAKSAGMLEKSWFEIILTMTLFTVALGPGGAVGLAYLYREYIITEKRHRAALTVESVGRRAAVLNCRK